MKFEKIGENKIKVSVSQEDLLLHGISFESFAIGTPAVQDFFRDLMKKAEYETDFVVDGGRVMIEAMHLQNEGFVIFITKPDVLAAPQKVRRIRYRARPRNAVGHRKELMYRFDNFDDLCSFAVKWRFQGEGSSLYKLNSSYILLLSFPLEAYDKNYVEAQVLEFGTPVPALKKSYLEEHGKKICDGDAIASILKYFDRK